MLELWVTILRWIRRPWPVALLFIGVAVLDPLGLSSASDRTSQDIVLRVLAPFYDSNPQPITVVLFDDSSLRELELYWPPPYSATTNLLRQVLCARPRAVFVDLLFTHQHEPDKPQSFENLVRYLSGGGRCPGGLVADAPVFVADMADQPGFWVPDNSVVFERLRLQPEGQDRPVERMPVNWVASSDLYPLVLADANPEGWPIANTMGGAGLPTPAFALYRVAMPGADPADFAAPMVVRWGFTPQPAPVGAPDRQGECQGEGKASLSIALWQLGMDLFRIFDNPREPRQVCPYTLFVSAHSAITGGMDLRELFHDRHVLIGASLAGASDVARSPVHGQLPGVFLHAMALDNLFRFHDDYWRPMPRLGDFRWFAEIEWLADKEWLGRIGCGSLLSIVLFLVLQRLNLDLFRPWRAELRRDGRPHVGALAWLEAMLGLALIAVTILVLALFNFSPINWLGLIALWLGAVQIVSDEFVATSSRVEPAHQNPQPAPGAGHD